MSVVKKKNFNLSNFSPQHPAAHEVFRAVFTKKEIIKNITKRNFSSNNNLNLSPNDKKQSKISETHINEFLTIINSFKKNPRQSRLINSHEIIDYSIQSSNSLNPIFISTGIWFQNSKTQIWSILIIEKNSDNFENQQNLVYLNLINEIKDISSNSSSYNFLYNNKTYQMDGTISQDSMNEIINKVDSNLVLKFLDNVSKKTNNSITDFDKFITIIILNNHKIVSSDENSSRLCGIVLPALFSNKIKYQIYVSPSWCIKSYEFENDFKNSISNSIFLQIPAPVNEENRISYIREDNEYEYIYFNGSLPAEIYNIRSAKSERFSTTMFDLKKIAEISGITHTNLDWVIFMLLTIIKLDDFLFSKIQNEKISDLSSLDIMNAIGYHLPVYYCMTDFNEYLNNKQIRFKETQNELKKLLNSNYSISKI